MRLKHLLKPVDIRPVPFTRNVQFNNADNSAVFAELKTEGSLGSEDLIFDITQSASSLIIRNDALPFEVQNDADAASNEVLSVYSHRATPTDSDKMAINFDFDVTGPERLTYAKLEIINEGVGAPVWRYGTWLFSSLAGGATDDMLKMDAINGEVVIGSATNIMDVFSFGAFSAAWSNGYKLTDLPTAKIFAQNEGGGGGKSLVIENSGSKQLQFRSSTDTIYPNSLVATGLANIILAAPVNIPSALTVPTVNGLDLGDGADADQDLITVDVTGTPIFKWNETADSFEASKGMNFGGNISVSGIQVVTTRQIDARIDDAINSGDATTDGVIDAMRDAMINHGLIAAA